MWKVENGVEIFPFFRGSFLPFVCFHPTNFHTLCRAYNVNVSCGGAHTPPSIASPPTHFVGSRKKKKKTLSISCSAIFSCLVLIFQLFRVPFPPPSSIAPPKKSEQIFIVVHSRRWWNNKIMIKTSPHYRHLTLVRQFQITFRICVIVVER